MGAKQRAVKAINAMKAMGFAEKKVRLVLKNLLRLYDRSWELIEDDQYTVLIDAIFEQEKEEETKKKNEEEQLHEEFAEPPLKKMRSRGNADLASTSGELMLRPKTECDDLPTAQSIEHDLLLSKSKDKNVQEALVLPPTYSSPDEEEQSQLCLRDRSEHHPISPQSRSRDKGKDPMVPSSVCRKVVIPESHTHELEHSSPQMTHKERDERQTESSFLLCFKEPKIEPEIIISPQEKLPDSQQSNSLIIPKSEPEIIISPQEKSPDSQRSNSLIIPKSEPEIIISPQEKLPDSQQSNSLIIPKSEPSDNYLPFEAPIGIIRPIDSIRTIHSDGQPSLNGSTEQVNCEESLASKDNHNVNLDRACAAATSSGLATVPGTLMSFEIASSLLGEVKISLNCSQYFKRPGIHVPSVDDVLKVVENKCLGSYCMQDPNFSVKKLFQETCQVYLDHGDQQDKV